MKIAYVTDSGCGRSIDEMAKDQIFSLPLQIAVDNKNFFDIEQVSIGDVIKALKEDRELSSSLPALGLIDSLFKKLKEEGFEKVIAVPICKGLSGTMNALYMTGDEYDLPVSCIDTYVTAVVEEYLIKYLKTAISDKGLREKEALENAKRVVDSCNTLLIPANLKHLTKSGRLTTTAARIGDFFKIKPILKINKDTDGKIDVIDKVRTFPKALDKALAIMQNEIKNDRYVIYIAHVDAYGDAEIFKDKVQKVLPDNEINIIPLCSPVALHTGLGCIAIQYFERLTD